MAETVLMVIRISRLSLEVVDSLQIYQIIIRISKNLLKVIKILSGGCQISLKLYRALKLY